MAKKKSNLLITIFLSIVLLILNNKEILSENKISINRKKFIIENLKPQVKYKVSNNIELFKKIFIGWWDAPPHGEYIFLEDGTFITNNIDLNYNNKIGYWFLKSDKIYLKFKEDKKWNVFRIDYYLLEFGEDMLGNKLDYFNLYIILVESITWDDVGVLVIQYDIDTCNK